MKKVLMTLTLLCSFFALTTVNAATKEEVNLKELKNDSMIIGHRIYDTNYLLSLYDIVSASSEYAAETGEQAPIYVYVVDSSNADNNFMIVYTGPVQEDGTVPTKVIEDVEEVYPGSVIDSTAINNSPLYDYMANIIEQGIEDAAKELNKTAKDNGFESIVYDKETKTGTFTIAEPKRSLADYKNSGIVELFLAIIENADSVTYTIGGKEVTVESADLTQTNVIEIAYALLKDMAGNAKELNYAAVANKKASATVKVNYDGFDYEETFTLEFVYNVEEAKDLELGKLAEELNEEADDYGFSYIEYDKIAKKGTFAIKNLNASLADYKDSGIVDMFLEFIKDSESVTYTIGGKEVTVETENLTQTNVIEIAYALLKDMAGSAKELNYAAVANKTARAKVLYLIGGEEVEITYTLSFTYNFEETKDLDLGKLADELNKEANDYGFESIVYDDETKTGTFTILDPARNLADYKDSGIVDMFLEFIADSKSVTYTIAGKEVTVETKDLTQTNVVEIAYALLKDMAGNAKELNYAAVANKTARAKVLYDDEVVYTYILKFVYDVEEANDAKLEELADELNDSAEDYGFASIVYADRTGTFTILDPTRNLADYKDSGIVDMFLGFIANSESVTYTIAGKEVTVETKDLTQTNVIEIAYALLKDMAGDAKVLNYAAVANKTASAKVVYLIGGEEVVLTYTVAFSYDIEETNDAKLEELADELNKTADDYGFASIEYDKEANKGTFTIAEETRALADYKDSGIVDMFLGFIANSESVTYTIGGKEVTVETKDLTQTNVVEIAYALLKDMAGDAKELNYAAVANKTASAKVLYLIGGEEVEVTYTLFFN